jgi:hypothetical protein
VSPTSVAERWPLVARRSQIDEFVRALSDPECRALLVHGPAGVGKTRFAEECLDAAERAGRTCGRAVATAATATIPLGAIAHLLPDEFSALEVDNNAPLSNVRVFARAARAIEDRGGGERFVLLVDDLPFLDVTSATLLLQLLVAGLVFLVGTVRSDVTATASVVPALWRDDHSRRIDLADLPRDSVETLLHLALGAPVDGPAVHTFWSASRGNVLVLRELVLGAQQSGVLVDAGGVWRLSGPLTTTPRMADLVAERIASVDDAGRRALEVLAMCQPLGIDSIERIAGPAAPAVLEAAGLVVLRSDGRRRQLELAHPLHGEVLRNGMAELRKRELLLAQVEALEATGARRREDALRIAMWRLEATGIADASVLVRAARLARYAHDYAQVVTLARPALETEPSTEAGLLLGEALYELGSFAEAETVLARATESAADDDELVTCSGGCSARTTRSRSTAPGAPGSPTSRRATSCSRTRARSSCSQAGRSGRWSSLPRSRTPSRPVVVCCGQSPRRPLCR